MTHPAFAPLITDPAAASALEVFRLAASAAWEERDPFGENLFPVRRRVGEGLLDGLDPLQVWPMLADGLMGPAPSRMLRNLRRCGALAVVLPEVDALFGIPQIAGDPPQVDIGEHLLLLADQLALRQAPLAVRFAALVFNVGKSDSPPEHLPAHYRHLERAAPRIDAICQRFGLAAEFHDLAQLVLAECERVHRVAEMRAASITALLERVDAFGRPARFDLLMTLCAADFAAFPGCAEKVYPKEAVLRIAIAACNTVDEAEAVADEDDPGDALFRARALAVAEALRSERWTDR